MYLSHEIGMRKPNAEIFEFVCKDQSINPSTALFIDDTIRHVEGAKSTGLNAYHLSGHETILNLFK